MLEPFQELPQLLDPHLPKWLPVLAEAYLESLRDRRRYRSLSTRSQLLTPLPNAICIIIYTLAKIRGEKVVVRFLNVETRYLELLLLAFEDSERRAAAEEPSALWTWHERYVVLIWLSQLFFAPFDLFTISSGDAEDLDRPEVEGFAWPEKVPGITLRVVPLATKYLACPGKERDGAKALLVRLAMRRDMQELGVLRALLQWCLSTLKPHAGAEVRSSYFYIGSLAFLSGVLRASENTSILDPYLSSIFDTVQSITSGDDAVFNLITGSALARKLMIKIVRSVTVLTLRKPRQTMADTEIVETSIGYMLERLADNDTPVRFAASKGLSIIAFKLEPDMASQVIEAVLESLNRNVLWLKNKSDPEALPTRDLTAIDPLEWHGLMLTLSHLLYRRSPPPENLSDIIHALLLGLAFEKRSSSGGSIGSNVRDASCFGIWAVARRYSTAELSQVDSHSVFAARGYRAGTSILQVIATELVVTASLDPAGNIRRGASAALQELIGRHPDTVEEGISVVQAVDYHAVALRSRAIHEVALQATRLSPIYGRALLDAATGWRGIGDMDAGARRVAAKSFGTLTAELAKAQPEKAEDRFLKSVDLLAAHIKDLQTRQVEERHGLLLSLAAVFDSFPVLFGGKNLGAEMEGKTVPNLCGILRDVLADASATKYRKPELIAEAVGQLATSSLPLLLVQAGLYTASDDADGPFPLETGESVVNGKSSSGSVILKAIGGLEDRPALLDEILLLLRDNVAEWLDRNEVEVIRTSSEAASVLILLSDPTNCSDIVGAWCERIRRPQAHNVLRNKHGNGFFHAITCAYTVTAGHGTNEGGGLAGSLASDVLSERWANDTDIDTRVAILQSLVGKAILQDKGDDFLPLISDGLDDYTTNARGDVGSHVRLEAIKATKTIWDGGRYDAGATSTLYPRILRLAAEKLDRVRVEAQSALAMLLQQK